MSHDENKERDLSFLDLRETTQVKISKMIRQ